MSLTMDTAVVLRPGQLRPGDVVADPEAARLFEVDEIYPTMIPYWGFMVPVYWIKGASLADSGKTIKKVQTVCLPRTSWSVLRRRETPDPS